MMDPSHKRQRGEFFEVVKSLKAKSLPDMSAWKDLFVPEPVLRALAEEKFVTPTPIQTLTLPSAIRDRLDIVGAAETGSGKTLAFGIPLIYHILEYKKRRTSSMELVEETDSDEDFETETVNQTNTTSGSLKGKRKLKQKRKKTSKASAKDIKRSRKAVDPETDSSTSESDGEDVEDLNLAASGGFVVSSKNIEDLGVGYAVSFGGADDSDDSDEEESDEDEQVNLSPDTDEEMFDEKQEGIGCVRVLNNVSDLFSDNQQNTRGKMKVIVDQEQPLLALILTPTRELAVQVKQHIDKAAKYTDIQTCVVVGGMSVQKQMRILKRKPDIVVATPGRLWELIQEGVSHLCNVEDIKYLVIDEADRMVEKGHFQELSQLLELINGNEQKKNARQTFVFSATLTLVHSGPNRVIKSKKQNKVKQITKESKLDMLMSQVGIKPKPKIIDLSRKEGTAQSLVESRITTSQEDKDLYLYYFHLKYPGRTLVFANSKDALRRLSSVLGLLKCKPLVLHADMRQKQRLKNLDRFKSNANGLLLATDVAARGLDIPNVQHVIHFQVPRTSENYVHRSGRTARASTEGLSVMLVSADDLPNYRKIIKTLNRNEELPMFPVEDDYLPSIKARVSLARQIDKMQHLIDKEKQQNSWFEKAAKEADLELDSDSIYQVVRESDDRDAQMAKNRKLQSLKMQLENLIAKPITLSHFSGKYPTKTGNIVVPYMKDEKTSANAANTVKNSMKTQFKHQIREVKSGFAKKRKFKGKKKRK